jgi:hypothetical protein
MKATRSLNRTRRSKFRRKVQIDESKTMSVPKAGKIYFGLGRDASYDAAKAGQIPVLRFGENGKRVRAIVPAIERMLLGAGKT